jgi:hypothetical protein
VREWRSANPERATKIAQRSDLKRRYGMTPEQYDDLLRRQGGACAICREVTTARLQVDHNHATGAVRGLLCTLCNTAIGKLRERPELFARAVEYLDGR